MHRELGLRGYRDPKFSYSTEASLDSAKRILEVVDYMVKARRPASEMRKFDGVQHLCTLLEDLPREALSPKDSPADHTLMLCTLGSIAAEFFHRCESLLSLRGSDERRLGASADWSSPPRQTR